MRYLIFFGSLFFLNSSISADGYQIWREVASQAGISPEILYSIALVESKTLSKHSKKDVQAWPWTLNSRRYGGQYFPTKKALIEDLQFLLNEGYTNIDIGIMQINWKHNGKRMVNDPIKLIDPEINIRTAGRLLIELMKQNNDDIFESVAQYHSYNKKRGHRYAAKVFNLSEMLKRQGIF